MSAAPNERHFTVADLVSFAGAVLTRAGLPAPEANYVGECLVQADMRGVGSHGLMRLRTYATRAQCGVVRGGVEPRIVRESPAFLAIDGGNGSGMWIAAQVMQLCVDRARTNGACFATVNRGNHFGIAATYTEMAAAAGMVGIAMSNAPASMVPVGGRRPLLGANPLSIAIPAGKHPPLVLDMATSTVAQGKIILAAKEGKTSIPGDWAVDSDGNPTTDPNAALRGAMLPFGGAKGYGIALIIDILVAVMSGALTSTHIKNFWKDFENPQDLGFFMGAWNIASVMPLADFSTRMETLIAEVKSCPPAPGHTEVFYPGEIEHGRAATARRSGVALGPAVVDDLAKLGAEHGVTFPSA